jgi:hypothetical protein
MAALNRAHQKNAIPLNLVDTHDLGITMAVAVTSVGSSEPIRPIAGLSDELRSQIGFRQAPGDTG